MSNLGHGTYVLLSFSPVISSVVIIKSITCLALCFSKILPNAKSLKAPKCRLLNYHISPYAEFCLPEGFVSRCVNDKQSWEL